PVQREKAAIEVAQVRPPSNDEAARFPFAPPFDHRSCCHTPMRLEALAGLTATKGSTSALTYKVALAGVPSQPIANGERNETRICGSGSVGPPGGGITVGGAELPPPPPPHAGRKTTQKRMAAVFIRDKTAFWTMGSLPGRNLPILPMDTVRANLGFWR